jgi:hypothetical protein
VKRVPPCCIDLASGSRIVTAAVARFPRGWGRPRHAALDRGRVSLGRQVPAEKPRADPLATQLAPFGGRAFPIREERL